MPVQLSKPQTMPTLNITSTQHQQEAGNAARPNNSCSFPHLFKVGLHASVGLAVAAGVASLAPVQVEADRTSVGKGKQRISHPEGACVGVAQADTATTIPATRQNDHSR